MATKLDHTCSCGDVFHAEADDHAGLGIVRMQYLDFKKNHEKCGSKAAVTKTQLEILVEKIRRLEDAVYPKQWVQSDPGTPSWQGTISGTSGGGGASTTSPPNFTATMAQIDAMTKQQFKKLMQLTPAEVPLFEKAVKEAKEADDFRKFQEARAEAAKQRQALPSNTKRIQEGVRKGKSA